MDYIVVLMMCPMSLYLEQELGNRFNHFKLLNFPKKFQFLAAYVDSISVVVSNSGVGPNAKFIDSFPNLKIVATYSIGHDKIDLKNCRNKGIMVTNTPDILMEDVADLAIALILALL